MPQFAPRSALRGSRGGLGALEEHGRKDAALSAFLATKGFYVRHPCGILAALPQPCRSRADALIGIKTALFYELFRNKIVQCLKVEISKKSKII